MTAPPLMHGFLRAQFVYLFRTFPLRRSWRHKLWILAEAAQLLVRYGLLRISLRFAGGSGAIDGKTCAVVLLTHNRPQNLTLLARGALGNGFVTKVVVSNSNHDVRIAEWIKVQDPRLVLTDEVQRTQPGHRLVLADRPERNTFSRSTTISSSLRGNGKISLSCSCLTTNVRTESSDRFIGRAPPLRTAARFIT